MNLFIKQSVLLFSAALLLNCSNQRVYEAINQIHYQACEEAPIQTQKTCRSQYSVSYTEYKRVREDYMRSSELAVK